MTIRGVRWYRWLVVLCVCSACLSAVLRAQCLSKDGAALRRQDVGKLDPSTSIKKFTIAVDGSDEFRAVLQAAAAAWNAQKPTTKAEFDVIPGSSGDIVVENDSQPDQCATAYRAPTNPPARIKVSNGFMSGIQTAYGSNGTQAQKDALAKLMEHEVGHLMLLDHSTSGSIMEQYTDLANTSCLEDLVAMTSWPSSLASDGGKVPSCLFGSDPDDPVEGEDDDHDPVPYDDGEICLIYNAYPVYDCYAESDENSASVTCDFQGYRTFGPPLSTCEGGPPPI